MSTTHFIASPHEQGLPLSRHNRALTTKLSTADLPASYLALLAEQNGGYVKNLVVPTAEPTSDGLDCAHIHYIFGLHEEGPRALPYQDFLPDYFIIFSAHRHRYFAFDYSGDGPEPAIRYLDTETDNWQVVAPDFASFLAALQPGEIILPLEGHLTRTEAEHAFLLVSNEEKLDALWAHLEDTRDKEWYFGWIKHFARIPAFRPSAFRALETQVLYFRRDLPRTAPEIFALFPEKAAWIKQELAGD